MIDAAAFLITHNLKNRFMRSVARLREPRYIAGALFAMVYFWSILFRRAAVSDIQHLRHGAPNEMMVLFTSAIALVLLIGVWALPSDAPGLVFSEPEIQFFFAGPVSRRQLLAYKIVRAQVQSIFSAIIFSFFALRGSHLLGMWLAFVVFDVYWTFVSFARARLKQVGIGWAWRLAGVAAIAAVIAAIVRQQFHGNAKLIVDAFRSKHPEALIQTISSVVSAPPLGTILYVPSWFGKTIYAPAPYAAVASLAAFALVLFFLTTQLDVAFEDASIVASQRALTRRARVRGFRSGRSSAAVHRMRPLFQLAEGGRPEVAVAWKNLIGITRVTSVPLMLIILPLIFAAGVAVFGRHEGIPDAMGLMGLMSAGAFVLLGPQAVRMDLRTDILRLDIVKAFPLSAESLIAAELAAPLVVISAFELVLLLVSVFALQFGGHYFDFFTTPEFVVCAFVFVVPVMAIQLLIQNGAMIVFPAWNMSPDNRGFSAIGQRFLLLLGNLLTLTVALIPAALVFFPSLWLAHRIHGAGPFGLLLATIPAVGVLVGEIFIGHKLLAAQFEDIDIANDFDALTE